MALPVEAFWAELLSRQSARIVEAWGTLNAEEQAAVWAHLSRMTTEDDWANSQRVSAAAALDVLRDAGFSG